VIRRIVLVAVAIAAATQLRAQTIADRIAAVRDGTVGLRFQSRPGVCGNADGGIQQIGNRPNTGDWFSREPCISGPVFVAIARAGNDVANVRTRVGMRPGDPSATMDLGDVSSVDAARYLATLAHHLSGRDADAALLAAVIADGYDVWPDFRRLVLDRDASANARAQALFWIGQSETPTANLVALYRELAPISLREQYTFVMSQRHDGDALDALIDVATHDRDTAVRKQAMFWLGQSRDPKAVKFFRDVLAP